jgi:signal transduction histidine kinase/DNA-binding response OmpR family regulator
MTPHLVLNVDDSVANRYLKTRALRQAGFHVIEAGTGSDALSLARERRPDLVLLDIKLPDMSGLEVCRLLKTNRVTERIPVVHISATFVDESTKSSSIDAGAEVYLAEPVGPHELASTVRTVMRLRAAEREIVESHERLRLATEGAGIATWDIPTSFDAGQWSPQFYAMLGCDPAGAPASLDTWLARVRDADRESVSRALNRALRGGEPVALEHWISRADNREERCIAVYGSLHLDDDGVPQRLIGVAMDITERKRSEAEREQLLEQARAGLQAAEEASRMKDEFLAILSHELRTPMSAMLGWLHLARGGKLSPTEQANALATVERNARLQSQLINDLLDVSRIITGKLERAEGVASIGDVVRSAVGNARLAARARRIEVEADIEAGRWPVRGNAQRLEQIFNNLLSNAIKFSPEGSRVHVRLARADDQVRVCVQDQGEGIPRDLLPHVFETFRQADSSNRRRHGGLGLGLAIARSLAELHGGTIGATSDGPGKGATFSVTLPLAAAALEADSAAQPTAPSLRGLRVLVVDDELDHLEMIAHMLRLEGATVATASNAPQALAAAEATRPDVLVLDIAMPGVDGYELLETLRQKLGTGDASVPAIALTGLAAATDAARAQAAGFQAHMSKPFEMIELCRLTAQVARRKS